MNAIKKATLFTLSLSFLVSCKLFDKGYIRYGVKNPYIQLETSNQEEGILKNELPSYIENKIQNEDTFMLYIHKITCEHCVYNEEHFFNNYLKENKIIVYGLLIDQFYQNENEVNIFNNDIIPIFKNKFLGTPFYALFQNGILISFEQDLEYFSLFFKTYIITN